MRLRVLHCIYDDPGNPWLGGGGARRVRELYERLTARVDATVATGAYPGARDGERGGVRYVHVGLPRPYAMSRLSYGRGATGLLGRGDYDAAVFDFSVYTPIRVREAWPVGHVVHMLMGPTARERWGRIAGGLVERRERRMLRRATLVQTTSSWMAEQLRPLVAPGARVFVVGSGVDEAFFRVESGRRDLLLYYGRFDLYQKGLDVLLAAAPRFLGPGSRLVLAGRGKDAAVVARLAASSPVAERIEVRVAPGRSEVLALLARARVLIHPSRLEGYPVVPAEAMAAGVPVVASDLPALREVLGDPPAGVLVPPSDAEALGRALASVADDDDVLEALVARARERATRFSWDAAAGAHFEFLQRIASR